MDSSIRHAIARIDVVRGGIVVGRGTASLVAENVVLTALHVVATRDVSPRFLEGQIHLTFPTHSTRAFVLDEMWDAGQDWVLLACETPPATLEPLRPVLDLARHIGDRWEAYGFSASDAIQGMVVAGLVEERFDSLGDRILRLFSDQDVTGQGTALSGLSGAPVVVADGVAGILRAPLLVVAANVGGLPTKPALNVCPMISIARHLERATALSGSVRRMTGAGLGDPRARRTRTRGIDRSGVPQSDVLRRTPHMDLSPPMPLQPGTAFTATVFADRLAPRPGETSRRIEVEAAAGLTRLDLEVWIAGSPHFTFPGARVKPFIIDLESDAPPRAEFEIQVRADVVDASGARLVANFAYHGRPCGQVSVAVAIGAGTSAPDAVASPGAPHVPVPRDSGISVASRAHTPDLTVEIKDLENSRQRLECRISTPHFDVTDVGGPFEWRLNQQTGALVQGYMAEFVRPEISAQARLESLRGAGRGLWDVTPKPFRDIFWKLVDAGKLETILIISEEPYIPWELMVPRRAGEVRQPLGTEFVVGRWLPNDFVSPVQQLVLSRSLVVAPDYTGTRPKPLAHAATEAALVLKVVAGEEVKPATDSTFRIKARTSTADLIHFVCHGAESNSIGVQIIYLEDCQLSSLQVAGMTALENAFRFRPLVFLNVCEIGRLAPALVGVGGFVKAFIDLGASAVIAPLWSVRDSVACAIAAEFYAVLEKDGRVQPAEVFRAIRARTYSEIDQRTAGEDTYAAYCFYGDPSALAVLASTAAPT